MSSARRSQPAFFLTVFSRYLRSFFFLNKKSDIVEQNLGEFVLVEYYIRPPFSVCTVYDKSNSDKTFFLPFQQQQTNRFVIVPFLIANMHT